MHTKSVCEGDVFFKLCFYYMATIMTGMTVQLKTTFGMIWQFHKKAL